MIGRVTQRLTPMRAVVHVIGANVEIRFALGINQPPATIAFQRAEEAGALGDRLAGAPSLPTGYLAKSSSSDCATAGAQVIVNKESTAQANVVRNTQTMRA